jgi:hypothetical protein
MCWLGGPKRGMPREPLKRAWGPRFSLATHRADRDLALHRWVRDVNTSLEDHAEWLVALHLDESVGGSEGRYRVPAMATTTTATTTGSQPSRPTVLA